MSQPAYGRQAKAATHKALLRFSRTVARADRIPSSKILELASAKEDRSPRRECISTECFGEETSAVNELPETRPGKGWSGKAQVQKRRAGTGPGVLGPDEAR